MSTSNILDPSIIKKTERRALWVLVSGGLCFIIALCSYLYAEYQYKTVPILLKSLHRTSIKQCGHLKVEQTRECHTDASVAHLERFKAFIKDVRPWIWTIPLMFISLSTILGYSGLIWWGVYQPASRRPFVAISAMGILIQTLLFIWLLIMRFLDLPVR